MAETTKTRSMDKTIKVALGLLYGILLHFVLPVLIFLPLVPLFVTQCPPQFNIDTDIFLW